MNLQHLFLLIVATAVRCIAADTTMDLRGEWLHTEGRRITSFVFGEAPGRVRCYDGVSTGKDKSVGTELHGKYEIDITHIPATLVIYFDDDPHYPKGFALHAIVEIASPKKLRMEKFTEKSAKPKTFSDKSKTFEKQ